jgi:prephenate dehydrogenase
MTDADQARVIGTHPLAGTSHSGFAAARADIFRGATVFVEPRGTKHHREDAERFWKSLGATRIEFLDADEHDARMAAVSHLPQLLATALASMLAKSGLDPMALGPGGRDMTRLATSPWTMWAPLLAAAPNRTVALLETFAAELSSLSASIGSRDASGMESTWSRASSWRDGVER